ncbi:MAG: hypothetical protein WAK17_04295 [Candidatus Nitrosopolaris sp.]|jgi:hypothetical protein
MKRLRLRIKRMIASNEASEEKEKLLLLLRTKKWNPYCISHSAIEADAAYLPEHALKKKVRWSMNSKQATRYVKRRMNDELTFKILEHDGIKLREETGSTSNIICVKCNYVNKLESKYCERTGCAYPLTQEAFEEIKKQEESRMNSMIDERLRGKDEEIQALKTSFKSYDEEMKEVAKKMEAYVKWQKKEEERRRVMYDTLNKLSPGWNEPYLKSLGYTCGPLTDKDRERLEEFQEQLRNAPDSDDYDDD